MGECSASQVAITLGRGWSERRIGMIARRTATRTDTTRRPSRILQVCDTQCDGLEWGNAKLCLASKVTETRLTSKRRTESSQLAAWRRSIFVEFISAFIRG